MDFDNYHNAESEERIKQIKEMILTVVKCIMTKVEFY